MTVTANDSRVEITGDGTDKAIPVDFEFFDGTDLLVTSRIIASGADSTLVKDTHYSVSGGDGSTGTVTMIDGATNFPATVIIVITRAEPATQTFNPASASSVNSETLKAQLNRLTMQVQEHEETLARCLKFPVGDAAALSPEVPNSVDRGGKLISSDASGNITVTTP